MKNHTILKTKITVKFIQTKKKKKFIESTGKISSKKTKKEETKIQKQCMSTCKTIYIDVFPTTTQTSRD